MRTYRNSFDANNTDREPSEYWLNIGYYIENPNTGEEQFISLLRGGVPLDNLEPERVSKPDSEYGQMLLAQNGLLKDLKEAAEKLGKGETKRTNLCVEIRRKKDSVVEDINQEGNFFYKKVV